MSLFHLLIGIKKNLIMTGFNFMPFNEIPGQKYNITLAGTTKYNQSLNRDS
jgi:hypothetical protein